MSTNSTPTAQSPDDRRTAPRIQKVAVSWKHEALLTGYSPEYEEDNDSAYYFHNNYTKIPNEFHVCPPETARRLFDLVIRCLASVLLISEEQKETYSGDGLYVTFYFRDGIYKSHSWRDMIFGDLSGLLHFSEFDYFRTETGPYRYERLFLSPFEMGFGYWGKKITLGHVRHVVEKGQIPFNSFYDHRVKALIEHDDGFDSRVVINPDNSVSIVGLTLWVAFPGNSIEISPYGQIVEDGGYPYVRTLKENGVKIVFSERDRKRLIPRSEATWRWGTVSAPEEPADQ